MRGIEPVMDDIFHQRLLTREAVRQAGESTSDDFYGNGKPDDYYDDLDDGPEGEDKHPDPFVQRMREQEKKGS